MRGALIDISRNMNAFSTFNTSNSANLVHVMTVALNRVNRRLFLRFILS